MSQQQILSLPSPAKLNLFLHVNGRLPNGYHELQTLFQFLDFGDTLHIEKNNSGKIQLTTPFENVSHNDNLIVKAAYLLKNESQTSLGATISIDKILPMGGGLGGGSSNAATVLLALNLLWDLNYSSNKLAKLGLRLGADVPIFIHGFAAFAEGVGEKFIPASPPESWYLVSKPNCSISTAEVFSYIDLPRNTPKISFDQLNIENCHNDCETIVIKHYPEVANLLAWLVEYAPSRMTGTGACIFSSFNTKSEALYVQSLLPNGVTSFVAKGTNQSPTLAALIKFNAKE